MWRTEWPPPDEPLARRQQSRYGVNRRHKQGLIKVERRQQRRQPSGQHGLASPGRAAHQEMVSSSSRDFERTAPSQLPAYVRKIIARPDVLEIH